MTKEVKCIVWDLDETIWDGTLLEGDTLNLRANIPVILDELGERGILNSISSRNERESALDVLRQLNIDQYFVAPQINFNPKADSLSIIAKKLNIGIDTLAFIDDSPFERQSVKFSHPDVLVLDANDYGKILDMPEFIPSQKTDESRQRVAFYQKEEERKQAELEFKGSRLEFLKSCQIELTLRYAQEVDVPRIVELSERTNQFNSTGIAYSGNQIHTMLENPNLHVIVAELKDKFGSYGNIGVLILKTEKSIGLVENLMISCRAAGRGVSGAMMTLVLNIAKNKHANILLTEYRENNRNRQLGIFYTMIGFLLPDTPKVYGENCLVFNIAQQEIPQYPEWLHLNLLVDMGNV